MPEDRYGGVSQSQSDEALVSFLLGPVIAEDERESRVVKLIDEWIGRRIWRKGICAICLAHCSFLQGGFALTYEVEVFTGRLKSTALELRGGAARILRQNHSKSCNAAQKAIGHACCMFSGGGALQLYC